MLLLCSAACVGGQANQGELQLSVTDPSGAAIKAAVTLVSQASQYANTLTTNAQGHLVAQHLPYGVYQLQIQQPGFANFSDTVEVRSSIPLRRTIQLKLSSVQQSVLVSAGGTLVDPDQAGSVDHVGLAQIQTRLASLPGRSLQDLVNAEPGWLYEGNAVLHPRASEYQTQFVMDGIPLLDNRSPSFGPEIEADDVQSMSIYTAGIPAEYGRKLGGVIEINTLQDAQPGFHGQTVFSGGSFDTLRAFAQGQYTWGKNTLSGSGSGGRTDHYLNPVVPENYSNTGTQGDFSLHYRRDLTPNDQVGLSVRHALVRYDIPNERIQQAAGQRQTSDNFETMGIASYQHIFSANATADMRGMVRDNASDFNSNPDSTPIEVFQHNSFRQGYFKAGVVLNRGHHEWKVGVESDSAFLHENLRYHITDPSQYDDGTPIDFAFQDEHLDLEQSVFLQDLIHLHNWTISAGLRWDHYQLLLNQQSLQPRLALSHYFPRADAVVHLSYDRVFQTPSSTNILLSSSSQIAAISPNGFLRLPVEPSHGDYYEVGLTKALVRHIRLDINSFVRNLKNYADDNQIANTAISFPISFRKAIIYGAEAKVEVPDWHGFSGVASYSYSLGNAWFPVTGGLFLGNDASSAASDLSGHFPVSQDQRNTFRGRVRYQIHPRLWVAGGIQSDSGLPFEFGGDPAEAVSQYGQKVVDRVNFDRGRILPSYQLNASAGASVYKSDRLKMTLQADGQNLNNVLDLIDFGGLFSGNAIGPSRSFSLRLISNF